MRISPRLTRRALLAGAAALTLARTARGGGAVRVEDVRVPGPLSQRFTLVVPTHLGPDERVPLVILLHGLGETGDARAGAYAWIERYGLETAYERLLHPPIRRTMNRPWLPDARLDALNAELAQRPLRGMVLACPYMPNLAAGQLDRYADWLTGVVIPRAMERAPVLEAPQTRVLGGCSLGGYVSLEAFLRRPDAFGAWAGVQTAIGASAATRYAERIADVVTHHGSRDIFLETSTEDPFRRANEMFDSALTKRGIARTWRMPPGPHDQPWLREVGTLELLHWADRRGRS